jgi:diguanylate cyclase (GGDEF)-like protein
MLDLDRFKVINDTLGHGAGDALLRTVAHRLQSCAQATDTIARLGGDEFAILQTGDFDQHEGAIAMASRVIESLSRAYHVNGHEAIVGTSIGIAMAPEHGTTTEQLLRNSDLALYQSKLAERNGFCFFEAGMEARASMRSRATCGSRWSATSSRSTINRSSMSRRKPASGWRRCCDGDAQAARSSIPAISSRSRKTSD